MLRTFTAAIALAATLMSVEAANAQAPAAAAPKTYSISTSTIGDLLANPAAFAIFQKYSPNLANNPQISQGAAMTMPDLAQYDPGLTPEKLAAMDSELKALRPQ